MVRLPGIEPGSNAWEASMIAITLQAENVPPTVGLEPTTTRLRVLRSTNCARREPMQILEPAAGESN